MVENKTSVFANPAPLGLMGFGMTTVLLNIHNAGLFTLGSMILAMGIFYGGIAQLVAGILEFKKGNTFGVTAFTSYGLFWLSFVGIIAIPNLVNGIVAPGDTALGWYLFMWGLFTGLMFISTLKKPKALQVVFLTLTILFWILALGHFVGSNSELGKMIITLAGYEGILCGLSAVYLAMAEVINETYGKIIIPVGKPTIR